MQVERIGLDIAKQSFHVHGVDAPGTVVIRTPLSRRKVLASVAPLPRWLVGVETCGGAHDWARVGEAGARGPVDGGSEERA